MKKPELYTKSQIMYFLSEFAKSGLSMHRFEIINGLGKSAIARWIRKYGDSREMEIPRIMQESQDKNRDKSSRERLLEERIKQLELSLKHEKLKSLAYKTMIDVAEEELGVEISKKAGAKQ